MKIRYKILCDILALLVFTVICYFIFKENVIYSAIGVWSFAITIGIYRAKEIYNIYCKYKERANGNNNK